MEYFTFDEFNTRHQLHEEVLQICSREGFRVYGSFASGLFHLDVSNWETHSDVDLIADSTAPEALAGQLPKLLIKRTGLNINVKVRNNARHISNLPEPISRELSFIDTAIKLLDGCATRKAYDYLIVKYVLRAAFLDEYLSINKIFPSNQYKHSSLPPIFWFLLEYKQHGQNLTRENLDYISDYFQANDRYLFEDLRVVLSLEDVSGIRTRWNSFKNKLIFLGFSELFVDLSQKLEGNNKTTVSARFQPNPAFDCAKRGAPSI